jgi:hypothetical protein
MAISCGSKAFITYEVQEDDSLVSILKKHGLSPLFGENGYIKSTKELNKIKIKNNGDLIHYGEKISLPLSKEHVNTTLKMAPVEKEKNATTFEEKPLEKPKQKEVKKKILFSRLDLSTYFSFLKIDSMNNSKYAGTEVSAISKLGFGVNLSWYFYTNPKYSFYGFGVLDTFSFYPAPNYVYTNTNIRRIHFGVGENINFYHNYIFSSKLTFRQITFLDILTKHLVNLESITIPEMSFSLGNKIFIKSNITGTAEAHISAIGPGNVGIYNSKWGYGIGTGLEIIRKNKSLFLNYDFRNIKINEIQNKESVLVIGINFIGENII